jgi:hypothetical protein
MGDTEPATALRSWRATFKSDADLLISDWRNIDQTMVRAEADRHAKESMTPAVNVMNALLYRANSYSIAPVGIFDVARVWPGQGPTRYGVGGGVRLSIVNANFTSGYALNPDPQGNEPRGALFFRISLTDLFH